MSPPGATVPSGPDWLHEIKHDGYRMMLRRENDRVRLITKGGLAIIALDGGTEGEDRMSETPTGGSYLWRRCDRLNV